MISCRLHKVVILVILFSVCSISIFAQTTYYYKQIKVIKNNQTIASGKGGQFISFYKDICYDSNNKGITVNNGILDLTSNRVINIPNIRAHHILER